MILKKYIQFINEKLNTVNRESEVDMYDLANAGISAREDGSVYISKKTTTIHVTNSIHEYGKVIYDLSDQGHNRLTIEAANAKLRSFKGLPEECDSFIGANNDVVNLEGGPREASYYSVNNCEKLINFEGAPMYCNSFSASNTAVRNCYGLDDILSNSVHITLKDNKNLEDLEGLPENTKYVDVSNCTSLTSLEHVPIDIEHITVKGCSSLKTLYHIRDINGGVFDTIKAFEGSGVPKIEVSYFLYNKTNGKDYYQGLFNHAKEYGIEDIGNVRFPASFIETLSGEDKELLRSAAGINKFKL
jgi:hypothetical protein